MPRVIKIKLSRVAIDRAIVMQSYDKLGPPRDVARITQSCPIFQALQIHFKGQVEEVGFDTALLKNGKEYDLDNRAQQVTYLNHKEWPTVKPMEFTIKLHPPIGYFAV
jgi:hypothetical protein